MDQSSLELSQKIDALAAQLQYLTEQARVAERERADRAELMRDLMPIANDAFRLTTEQLEEVQEYVDLNDLLRLFKRLLRNGRNIEAMLDQLESVMDLAQTVGPLSDDAFCMAVNTLQEMEQKGYFVFLRGGMRMMDNIVTSFTEEDVQALADNIVLILRTVKSMTQPQIMRLAQNTVQAVEPEPQVPVDISYRTLFAQMRDPNVRRGLALTMRMLSTVGEGVPGNGQVAAAKS
ncbi:MAG: hypothetical protein U0822_08970 [Anaerolineae bacterium]